MTEWATDLVFDSLGTVIRVRCDERSFGADVELLMTHFPSTERTPDHTYLVAHNADGYTITNEESVVVGPMSRDRALIELLVVINEMTVLGSDALVVHAGVVARDRAVVCFPASRNAGKSTLTAACIQTGFDYVSDEALFLDTKRDRVVPYPKPLWLTSESWSALDLEQASVPFNLGGHLKSPILPGELGGRVASGDLELKHVILLERDGGKPRLEQVGRSDGAYQLLRHAFNRYQRPEDWFHATSRAMRGAQVWSLWYGSPREAAVHLDSQLKKSGGLGS